MSETDWESEDGLFQISRSYRSNPVGRSASFQELPRGLAAGWTFDFAYEIQLSPFSGSPSSPNATLAVVAPDGTAYDFRLQPNGQWTPNTASGAAYATTELQLEYLGTLPANLADIQQSSSQWRLTDETGHTWIFDTFTRPNRTTYVLGRPTERTTRQGYVWTFTYGSDGALDTIADSFGRTATFSWSDFYVTALPNVPGSLPFPEAVKQIALPDGSQLVYTYDPPPATSAPSTSAIERLVQVQRLDASSAVFDSTLYHYEDSRFRHHLTGVTDHRAVRVATYAYDARGRAVTTQGADGADTYQIEYTQTTPALTRRVVNPLGRATVYRFQRFASSPPDIRLVEMDGEASPNCPASSAEVTYASNRFIATETDEEGRVTSYQRDARGRPLVIVQADGTPQERSVAIDWHPTLDLPTQVEEPGLTTDMVYSAEGRLLSLTQTDTTTHTAPYPTNGRSRTWAYGYTTEGLISSIDGPLPGTGDTTAYSYSPQGYLAQITNPVGHTVTVTSHDGRGAPLVVEDENGIETVTTYDLDGRPRTIVVDPGPDQSAYQMAYDPVGNLSRLDLPQGGWLEYAYDGSSRVTGVENDRGETQSFTLNDAGQPETQIIRDPSSAITMQMNWAYDELGRVIQAVGAGAQTWGMAYDKVSNLVEVTDARDKTWSMGWDALDRVISETDPEAAQIEYEHAPNDALTGFEDARDLATTMVVDGFGLTVFENSPDRGERTYWYDEADRLTRMIDADGVETLYAYDDADRLLSETFTGSPGDAVTYSYDSVAGGNAGTGRLTGVDDPSGLSALTYDAQGRLTSDTKTIGGETYAVAYAYDGNGDRVGLTYPSGRVVQIDRDPDGQITALSTRATATAPPEPLASGVSHAPFGPLTGLTHGNGLILTQSHDQNYWQTGLDLSAPGVDRLDLTFSRDQNGALDGVGDALSSGRVASFGYTDAGRLQYGVGAWGDHSWVYDAAGNRVETRTDVGGVVDYTFAIPDPARNRIEEVRDSDYDLTRDLTWRFGGDLYQQSFTGGDTQTLLYDARKRLVELDVNGTTAANYAHDHAGRRVSATTGGQTTHFVFDDEGRLLAEHDGATGAVLREYVWLDDRPLALIVTTAETTATHFIHTGQIGEPLMLTDAAQAVVWDAAIDPWGQAVMLSPASLALDLRLMGQWRQDESGLHQNWMRDYDPTLGRYVQADPLGLAAGQNLYAYVDGDPLNTVDPTGEIGVVGAFVGAGLDLGLQLALNGGRLECVSWTQVGAAGALGAIGVPAVAGRFSISAGRGANAWLASNAVRRFRRANNVPTTHDVHHWVIPTRFERSGPTARRIVNHPWNFNPIPRADHRRIHLRETDAFTAWSLGTPSWARAAQISTGGGVAGDALDRGCGC